jgi:hypothetical protein
MHKLVDQACMVNNTRSYKRLAKLFDVGVNATNYPGLEGNVVGFTFDVVLYGSIELQSSTAATFCSITNQVFQKLTQLVLWDGGRRWYSQSCRCRRSKSSQRDSPPDLSAMQVDAISDGERRTTTCCMFARTCSYCCFSVCQDSIHSRSRLRSAVKVWFCWVRYSCEASSC